MLRWVLDSAVVDESSLVAPKDLTLEARAEAPPPQEFQVFQVYSSALRQLLRHVGVPDRHAGPRFGAVAVSADLYHGDREWRLPTPRGSRKSATYLFSDDVSRESGLIYSSRIGRPDVHVKGGMGLSAPAGPLPIGLGGEASLQVDFQFAVDPTLVAEVLTGEALVEHILHTLTDDYLLDSDADVQARVELALPELRDLLAASYTPPAPWDVVLSRDTISGDAGSLESLDLDLTATSEGVGYYAVSFFDPDREEFGETTDVWAFDVDAEGVVRVWLDVEELPLRDAVIA